MLTSNIILPIALIALMGIAVFLILRYSVLLRKLNVSETEIELQKAGLQKRHNALDLWEKQIRISAKQSAKTVHAYANKTVDDPEDKAPEKPTHEVYKKLASQFGYSAAGKFKDRITRKHDGGKTTYSLDLNIYPYDM